VTPEEPQPRRPSGTVRVGTSGWRYAGWRGDFYPSGLRQRDELAFAASRMTSIEINGSFYSLQRPSSYESWRQQVPDDFGFAVKGGRYITHMRQLVDVEASLANFFASGVLALGSTLDAVLWQLPARQAFDPGRLSEFFALLPRTTVEVAELASRHDDKLPEGRALTSTTSCLPVRHALEPRHESFGHQDALALLREHDIALVQSDSAGTWPQFSSVTSSLVYVRLHGDTELYSSGYSDAVLDGWADRINAWTGDGLDVLVYFDNDARGHAPHDAVALLDRLTGPRDET
jgi:uncharacterized protein YecE (DUF72 family)